MSVVAFLLFLVVALGLGAWAAIFAMNLMADAARASEEERFRLLMARMPRAGAIVSGLAAASFALGVVVAG